MFEEPKLAGWAQTLVAHDADSGASYSTIFACDYSDDETQRPLSPREVLISHWYDVVYLQRRLVLVPLAPSLQT